MQIINCDQKTEEWQKIRLGKFGGTDAQAVATAGKGLETLCYQKVGEILTQRPAKEPYTNGDLERGNELEPIARQAYELQTGSKVIEVGYILKNEFVGVSPDGLVGDDGMIEIKCPSDAVFVRYLFNREIDPKYQWQMQHELLVAERKWVDFVVFNDNLNRLDITRVERDEFKIEKIRVGLEQGEAKIKQILERVK